MRKKLTNLLRLAQLKDEEITLYLLLLKLKQATISQLVEKSQLNFMMVYRTIKRLRERGLIDAEPVNNKQDIYKPLSLKAIIDKVHAQQRKLKRLENGLKGLDDFLPYIDLNEKDEETIQLREGIDAFMEEYLKLPELCEDEYLHIGNMYKLWDASGLSYEAPEERNFIHRRINRGVHARILNMPDEKVEEVVSKDTLEKRTSKIKENLPVTENYLAITDEQASLFICDHEDPRVIVIKQPELLGIQRDQFKTLWTS
jgi:sugar-specific transcriptional regulator TrmB